MLTYPCKLPLSEVRKLPVTLTCLEGHIEDGLSDQLLSILPPNLTKLKTVYKPSLISIEALQQAPRGLIDIRSEIGMGQSDILQYFHPDSTTIRFGRNLGNRVAVPLNLHPFPSKLTRLKLGCFTDELCLLLPSELESLSLQAVKSQRKEHPKFQRFANCAN